MTSMPKDADYFKRFLNLQIGRSGDERAPHKPLLVLWAIGRCLRGEQRLVSYEVVDRELARLINRFGPHGRPQNTHYPFWRLQNDGIWEVDEPDLVQTTSSGEPLKSDLRQHHICAGFTDTDYVAFRKNPMLARRIAEELIAKHFPSTMHLEILEATVIPFSPSNDEETQYSQDWLTTRRRWRDSTFRRKVLEAYDSICAVCEFSVHFLDLDQPLAIEAAHIKWHECNGPAVVENGLALCALHHRLFDKGAFTVLPDLKVRVSPDIKGDGVVDALKQYDSEPLRSPPREAYPRPKPEFLLWHSKQVFKNPEITSTI